MIEMENLSQIQVTPTLHQINWLPFKQLLLFRDSVMAYNV